MSRKESIEVPATGTRLSSIDLLRGAIMVLMAVDHVRVYSGLPAGGFTAGIFFTRWITHFCAPGFVFLAGVSAFLYGNRIKDKGRLSRFLVTRGLLLVLLELTFIRFCWAFHLNSKEFMLAGVIWMLGWCMVLLAAFVRLRPLVAGITGLCIIAGQQLFQYVPGVLPLSIRDSFGKVWEFVYPSLNIEQPFGITILYVLVPWIGVMLAGYGFGELLLMDPVKRRRLCRWIGFSSIALFLIVATIVVLSQPPNPLSPSFILRLLNQQKYPASQLFLLMTLGPLIVLLPYAEKARGWLARAFIIFGSVPMFYYLLHIPLIHLTALAVNWVTQGSTLQSWYITAPYSWLPPDYQWSLWLLYLVFLVDVILLFFACRWYAKYKREHPGKKWLKYI